ncbi:hypothetical protein POBR111598_10415 [Polynucleobacter brandtiae]
MALVLIAVVPEMERFLLLPVRVTVSLVPLPKTALPVMAKLEAPATVPLKLAVLAVKVASAPKVTLLL